MAHRGEIVKNYVNRANVSKTQLAKGIGYSREHLYNLFNDPELSWDIIVKIGKFIHHDFTEDFTDSPFIVKEADVQYIRPTQTMNADECLQRYSMLWDKYTRLLEDYKDLSDKHLILQNKYK